MTGEALEGERLRIAISDGDLHVLRFGRKGAPPLLFAHANGFCASAYRQMLMLLGDAFDVYAVDLRGHGKTSLPTENPKHRGLSLFGRDVSELLDRLADEIAHARWRLAGHSLGGVAVTFASAGREDVEELRLIEPVAMSPYYRMLASTPFWPLVAGKTYLVRAARRRRARWRTRSEVFERYRRKGLFKPFAAGVLEDYLEDGLSDDADGVALSCAPLWEATNFAAQADDFWAALKKAPAPVSVLAANHPQTSTVSRAAARRFRQLGASVEIIDGPTHLIPFEAPARAASFLKGETRRD
ncbi:MAG: alpha/beta hydrolase [Parvularculaceae bacterium]